MKLTVCECTCRWQLSFVFTQGISVMLALCFHFIFRIMYYKIKKRNNPPYKLSLNINTFLCENKNIHELRDFFLYRNRIEYIYICIDITALKIIIID